VEVPRVPASTNSKPAKQQTVTLELNPASGVDVLGDATPPLLWVGMDRDFTEAEAELLLARHNAHGTPIVRIVRGAKK
jgi:hypothetical protein